MKRSITEKVVSNKKPKTSLFDEKYYLELSLKYNAHNFEDVKEKKFEEKPFYNWFFQNVKI